MTRSTITSFRTELIRTPLLRPFETALGRRTETVNAAFYLTLADGTVGYGEASTSLAQKHLTAEALSATLQRLGAAARGRDAREWRALSRIAWKMAPRHAPAVAAFESAVLAALCRASDCSMTAWFGGALSQTETDLTISASTDTGVTEAAVREAVADGFHILKVKVGGEPAKDLARLQTVRHLAPRCRILLDGNQGFTPRGALSFLERARSLGTEVLMFEQPVAKENLAGMAFVAQRAGIPIAADESVATPAEAFAAINRGAATAINVKLAKSGIVRALDIVAVARAAKVPLMIGCMAETARGLATSVHMALGLGAFDFVDLDSDVLLAESPTARAAGGWSRRGPLIKS